MTLVEELRSQGIDLEANGDRLKIRGPVDRLTPELRSTLAEKKGAVLALLRSERVRILEERIRFARGEAELEDLVDEIQAGFEASHLSQEQAERLGALTLDTARQLRRGLVNVPMGTTA